MIPRGDDKPGCLSCAYLTQEDDGNYPEFAQHGLYACELNPQYENLKSFPFKKQKQCYQKDFWYTEFAEKLTGHEKKDDKVFAKYRAKYVKEDPKERGE